MSTTHYNQLNPGEQERLAKLAEECAEVIQVIGKILCHGYSSIYPESGPTNRMRLEEELGHLKAWEYLICKAGDISQKAINDSMIGKAKDVEIRRLWVHHQ